MTDAATNSIGMHIRKAVGRKRASYRVSDVELEYIMSRIDIEDVLTRLKIEFNPSETEYIWGYCPDHYQFVHRYPSDPKWSLNVDNGRCYCWTEGRGSNIVEIVKNVLGLPDLEAARTWLIGDGEMPSLLKLKMERKPRPSKPVLDPRSNETLISLHALLDSPVLDDRALLFFVKDGIKRDTLERFKVISMRTGRYKDRAIIPFFGMDGVLVGFAAVYLLGRKHWVRENIGVALKETAGAYSDLRACARLLHKKFKKVLFCDNTNTGMHLFGMYELVRDKRDVSTVILVEGERDAMKLQQEGFSAVGTHGTQLSAAQRKILLLSGTRNIVVAYDNDSAGSDGADRIVANCSQDFTSVTKLSLPDDRDPKGYTRMEFQVLLDTKIQQPTGYWEALLNAHRDGGLRGKMSKGSALRPDVQVEV